MPLRRYEFRNAAESPMIKPSGAFAAWNTNRPWGLSPVTPIFASENAANEWMRLELKYSCGSNGRGIRGR
jgi:hypothetical protein